MKSCADQYPACDLAACYPCYCGGLAAVEQNFAGDGDWLTTAKYECAPYIDSFDFKSMGIRCGGAAASACQISPLACEGQMQGAQNVALRGGGCLVYHTPQRPVLPHLHVQTMLPLHCS